MSDIDRELAAYGASLDAALVEFVRHGNDRPIQRHIETFECGVPPNDSRNAELRRCAFYKAATGRVSLPMDVRSKAKRYLIEHGFQSWDDGDVET